MSLKNIIAFGGRSIDISVIRSESKVNVNVSVNGKQIKNILTDNGSKVEIKL